MRKAEIKTATNSALVYEYAQSYSTLCLNINLGRGTKQAQKHCNDLEEELLKRELLTVEQIKMLNS